MPNIQRKVKCYSKCMNIWAWILVVWGAYQAIAYFLAFFNADSYTSFNWFDKDEKKHSGTISIGFTLLSIVYYILVGLLNIRQGRSTHKVF